MVRKILEPATTCDAVRTIHPGLDIVTQPARADRSDEPCGRTHHEGDIRNVLRHERLRADVVTETDRRADFQAVAPETEAGLYLVPRVVE